jgi:glutamate 5-kinase
MRHHRIIDAALVKVGSDGLTTPDNHLDKNVIASIAAQLAEVRQRIQKIGLVSSGAVTTGRDVYGLPKRDDEDLATLQMYASAGQPMLFAEYLKHLQQHGCIANQILVTHSDMDSRLRRRNLRRTLGKIFSANGCSIPIFNENDSVAVREFRFDNDQLAGDVARLIGVQRVLFLTSVPGILRDLRDPAGVIREIPFGSKEYRPFVSEVSSRNGRGGMRSKARVAELLARQGIESIIANGHEPDIITRILLENEQIGTRFLPAVRV